MDEGAGPVQPEQVMARIFGKSLCGGFWLEEEENACEPSAGSELDWCGSTGRTQGALYEMLPASLAPLFCGTFHVFPSDQLFYISMQNTNPDSFTEVNTATTHLFWLNMKLKLEGCFHAVNLVGAYGRNTT